MNEPYHNLTRANNNQLTGLIYKKVTNSLPGSNTKVICNDDGRGDDDDDDLWQMYKQFLDGKKGVDQL